MFSTMNGLLLSRFGDCDTAAYTLFSVCIFFTVEVREGSQILLTLFTFLSSSSRWIFVFVMEKLALINFL